jgi:predicted dehydrogenase
MTKLRVGVVGGGIGREHIRALQTLPDYFTVAAVCDSNAGKAQAVAAEFGVLRAVTAFDDLCALDDLDIIDICTPSYLHYAHSLQALAAGKHVVCEKPVGAALREVDDLAAAAARAGRCLMPIYQYRFGHGAQKLKRLVAAGVTGPAYLTTAETAWRRRLPYYEGTWRGKWDTELGGALVTLAIHAHDLITYILGPVKNVFARTLTAVNAIETEDCVSASLQMADGSLVSLSVTTGSAHEISRHRFCFRDLTAESSLAPYANTSDPWRFDADSPATQAAIDAALADFTPLPEQFAGQFLRFAQTLAQGAEPPVTLADARTSLELITALYQSSATGQPVDLPIPSTSEWYGGWRHAALTTEPRP